MTDTKVHHNKVHRKLTSLA